MTRTRRGRWSATAVLLVAFPTSARADSEAAGTPAARAVSASLVRVDTSGCPALRPERVGQLLRLEMATLVPMVDELPTLDVAFQCAGNQATITLRDPVTVKVVSRDVAIEASADAERSLALATSELFLASWAELLIPRPENKSQPASPAVAVARHAVELVVPARPSEPTMAVDLHAVGRERHLSTPILTVGATLRVGQSQCRTFQFFSDLGWETGSAARTRGRVDITGATLGAGLRSCLSFANAQVGFSGSIGGAYISLQGVSTSPAFFGAHIDGFGAEAAGSVDASVTWRPVRVGVALLVGALAAGPIGDVKDETPVRFDGLWAGVTIFAGLLL